MRLCWGFLREFEERMKNLKKRRQSSLRNLNGDGENGEKHEMKERNGGCVCFIGWLKLAREKKGKFDDLCPKLEEVKKNMIDGPKCHFQFCWIYKLMAMIWPTNMG